jgi:hypothetical protein
MAILTVALLIIITGAACGNSGPSPEFTALSDKVVALEKSLASSQEEIKRLAACAEATSPNDFCDVDAAQANNIMATRAKTGNIEQTLADLSSLDATTQARLDRINKTITAINAMMAQNVQRAVTSKWVSIESKATVDSLIPAIWELCDIYALRHTEGCATFNEGNTEYLEKRPYS